jgi:hypothetical protein
MTENILATSLRTFSYVLDNAGTTQAISVAVESDPTIIESFRGSIQVTDGDLDNLSRNQAEAAGRKLLVEKILDSTFTKIKKVSYTFDEDGKRTGIIGDLGGYDGTRTNITISVYITDGDLSDAPEDVMDRIRQRAADYADPSRVVTTDTLAPDNGTATPTEPTTDTPAAESTQA